MKVKSNIYELIGLCEMSLAEASRRSGYTYQQLNNFEKKGCIPWMRLKRLADALGCTIDDLFTVEEEDES
jgi:DNA-binding Xre family transcriptional regulator